MAEEFQAEVCGDSWWSSPRATFNAASSFIPSYGGGCWQNDFISNFKTRSTNESSGVSPDSASCFQIITSSPSSTTTTTTWNQALLANGRNHEEITSYNNQTLPEILNNLSPAAGGTNNSLNIFGMEQDHDDGNYPCSSTLLQTLFDATASTTTSPSPPQLSQQPVYDFEASLTDFNPSMPAKQQHHMNIMTGGLRLANKTPFWNASSAALNDLNNDNNRAAAAFFASTQSRFLSTDCPNIKSQNEQIRELGSSVKKSSGEPAAFKRPRLETPSPLPTFKVRKEKLGDRVTALQQLVSPFGKTDTASVLHEAIEYIKLLHDQVNVLSTPYMKSGATTQMQQIHKKVKDNTEGAKQQDLRSRGLCLVPVSVTFPVATETAPDYWTSSFGSTFK